MGHKAGPWKKSKLGLAVHYMLHHTDNFGPEWNIQLGVTPVIPNLIKGILFGE